MAIVVNSLVIKGVLIKIAQESCGVATYAKWQICY